MEIPSAELQVTLAVVDRNLDKYAIILTGAPALLEPGDLD
jgi:hypothetical protein